MTKCDDGEIKQSLADRMRALQINQENWKNRINKKNEPDVKQSGLIKKRFSMEDDRILLDKKNEKNEKSPNIEKRNVSSNDKELLLERKAQTVNKLADRMLSLEKSAKQWRNRVADKDNQKFTISGKMASLDYTTHKSNENRHITSKVNHKIELTTTKDSIPKNDTVRTHHNLSTKENDAKLCSRKFYSTNLATKEKSIELDSSMQKSNRSTKESESIFTKKDPNLTKTNSERKSRASFEQTIVEKQSNDLESIKLDDSFEKFFKPIKIEKVRPQDAEENHDFLNDIDQMTSSLLVIKKGIKHVKNRKASNGNPLKKMLVSPDIESSNFEINSNQSTPTINNSTIKQQSNHSFHQKRSVGTITSKQSSTIRKDLDPTAKAGLESKEDYQSVASKLKKSSDTQEYLDSNNLLPNKHPIINLIQVKGRKKVQVRIVEPDLASINEGDSYVLVNTDRVIIWIGQFTNIIERTKVLELGNKIFKRRELGFRGRELITIDNAKKTNLNKNDINTFRNLLSSSSNHSFRLAGDEDEDDIYENSIIKTNRVFIFDQDRHEFKENDSMSARQLYQHQLNPYETYLFDFTTEFFIWLGFYVSNETRTIAIEKAKQFYSQNERLPYTIFYKCNQNMELILFQEKFFDWTTNRKLKSRTQTCNEFDKRMNLKAFDVSEMLQEANDASFMLDNTNIGRGDFYKDDNELLYIEVVTDDVKCWLVNEYEKKEITDERALGQFRSNETYVIRWQYRINRHGNLDAKRLSLFKSINPKKSSETNDCAENIFKKAERVNFKKHKEALDNNVTGRERYCYFYWSGSDCSLANKGAAALMAIELDKEKGTQIQVEQCQEPPCFLRLFRGKFVILNSVYSSETQEKRLFLIKGVYAEEASLYEVRCEISSLRSKGCFVLIDFKKRKAFLWIGQSANSEYVKIANSVIENINHHNFNSLSSHLSSDHEFTWRTVKQTFECLEFLDYFDSSFATTSSAIRNLVAYEQTNEELSAFYLSSLMSGEFMFKRLVCTYSANGLVNNFPFEQKQIYSVNQPAFFMFDNGQTVYLWQGHFPVESEDTKLTGSLSIRYSQEKKCALETVLSYCHKKYQNKPVEAYLIHAGLEPTEFIQLFPEWWVHEEIRELQLADGQKKEGEMNPVREVLTRVCNLENVYKLKDLQNKSLPDGINPLIIETYLSDLEFEEVFGMNKGKFYLLPAWKQNKLKQTAGLF